MQHIGDDDLIAEDADEPLLQLQTLTEFDLGALIANGPRLLSSTTNKYDQKAGGGNSSEHQQTQQQHQQLPPSPQMTQKQLEEKIRQQRRLLNSKSLNRLVHYEYLLVFNRMVNQNISKAWHGCGRRGQNRHLAHIQRLRSPRVEWCRGQGAYRRGHIYNKATGSVHKQQRE
jgi:hypothetical protein